MSWSAGEVPCRVGRPEWHLGYRGRAKEILQNGERSAAVVQFETDAPHLQDRFEQAKDRLKKNVRDPFVVDGGEYSYPILIEGGVYSGCWLECGPMEAVMAMPYLGAEVAIGNHMLFFDHQRADGALPCWFIEGKTGYCQIQMVVPIAESAWNVYCGTGDSRFLEKAYAACAKWDMWLMKYRDSKKRQLVELFCEYDTGHDNSGRFSAFGSSIPRECPAADRVMAVPPFGQGDARICRRVDRLPWYAPDLSANLYGGRQALAWMAREMGDESQAEIWENKAEQTRRGILAWLFDPESLAFYDLNCEQQWNRILSDAILRTLAEGVPDQRLAEEIFERHILRPDGFWPSYPLPSIAVGDPEFKQESGNSWGGPSQALAAIRAPRTFERYGKYAELNELMKNWIEGLCAIDRFPQQRNAHTGVFSEDDDYTPSIIALLMFTARSFGIIEEDNHLKWNCQLPRGATCCAFTIRLNSTIFSLETTVDKSVLRKDGSILGEIRGHCQVLTSLEGKMLGLVGIIDKIADIEYQELAGRPIERIQLMPNQMVPLHPQSSSNIETV